MVIASEAIDGIVMVDVDDGTRLKFFMINFLKDISTVWFLAMVYEAFILLR
jgi:hypothetical protein